MNDRTAVTGFLAAAALLVLVGGVLGGRVGTALLAVATPAVPAAIAILAAGRRRRRAVVAITALALASQGILLAIAFWPWAPGERVVGLPPATWLALLGLGIVPLVGVPLLYAAGFAGPPDEGRS